MSWSRTALFHHFVTLGIFALLCLSVSAQTSNSSATVLPNLIRFSGVLTSPEHGPQAGTIGVTFALYKDEQGGSPLWIETQNVVSDATGHYSALLGTTRTQGLPADLFASGEARWLGVKPEGGNELPRILLVSVPYALKAGDAETLGGHPLSAFLLNNSLNTSPVAKAITSTAIAAAFTAPTLTAAAPPPITANYVPLFFDGTGTLGNSVLFQSSGNIGINTTSPQGALDVNGGTSSVIFRDYAAQLISPVNNGPQFAFVNAATPTAANWRFGVPGVANSTGFFIYDNINQNAPVFIEQGASADTLHLQAGGKLGVGTASPSSKLTVNGTVESLSGGFKFPDGTIQSSAGLSQAVADGRYLNLIGGTVTGPISATSFSGNGANLTSLNAGNLTGTVPNAALAGMYSGTLSFTNAANTYSGNGSGLTNLTAGNLTGTINSLNLPNGIAYTNVSNSYNTAQYLNGGASIGVPGTGTSGQALNIYSNDNSQATVTITNSGTGPYLQMYGGGNGGFNFYNNGYLESNGWAPTINYDAVGAPVSAGQLVKFTSGGLVAPLATTDVGGALGVVAQVFPPDPQNNNKTKAQVVIQGVGNCNFDNTAVVGDYVGVSSTVAGDCHDVGSSVPSSGQIVGRVVDTKNGNQVYFAAGQEARPGPSFLKKLNLKSQTAAIATTTLFTVPFTGMFRINIYMASNNTANGTVNSNLNWTDDLGSQTLSPTSVSSVGAMPTDNNSVVIHAVSGTNVSYSTQFTGVTGTPSYNLFYSVEALSNDSSLP